MATANELFAANGEDYIVIDSDLRTMTFPASVNNIGVENDKDVHKLNFKMPRYFSGYDLSKFIIHINYVNANGDADMYYVLDPTVEENEIIFSWLVGRHACLYRGSVTFIVCLKLADGEGDVAQEFNTTLASLQVLPGLETEPTILETEHDIIEQLLLSINDTNAKIKAVLDTGLTPEQIAEFYDKSKTYDTQITANANKITAINSRIPHFVNGVNQWNGFFVQGSLSSKGEDTVVYTCLRSSFVRVVPSSTYYMSVDELSDTNILIYEIHCYKLDKTWIKLTQHSTRAVTFDVPSDCEYIKFLLRKTNNSTITVNEVDASKIMLNISDSAIDGTYSAYEGFANQSEVDALNSSSMRYFPVAKIPQGADLDTIYSGNYFCNTNTLHQTILHKPSGVATIWRLHVIAITNDGESDPSTVNAWMKRIQILEDETGVVFQRTIKGTGSTSPVIGEWEKLPTRAEVDALNSRWKRIASIESVDSLVQTLVPAGTPNNMMAGFLWLQDLNKIIIPTLGWYKGYYIFQNVCGSPYDAGGYIYLTGGNGKPYGEIYITGTSSGGFTAVLNNNLPTRAEIDALSARVSALEGK